MLLCFSLAVTSTGVNVHYSLHTCPPFTPIRLHYFAVYRLGLEGADSYFRFHHFLFIIHRFHSDGNNHISIRAFFSDFKYVDKHRFVLCQASGVFCKNRGEISTNELLKPSPGPCSLTLELQVIRLLGRRNFLSVSAVLSSSDRRPVLFCSFHSFTFTHCLFVRLCLCIEFPSFPTVT